MSTIFPINTYRLDPYKNFKFRVKWDGKQVAAVSKISGVSRKTDVIEFREGGDPSTSRKSPGKTKYSSITLERGITHDAEFKNWMTKVWNYEGAKGNEISLKDFRKSMTIEIYNEADQKALALKLYNCWVSEYHIGDLDANAGSAILIERIVVENQGFIYDPDVPEPSEPKFG